MAATPRPRSSSAPTPPRPVVAELVGSASVTDEFVERWRAPGEQRTKIWDDKFSEISYVPLGVQAWNAALAAAGLTANDVAAAAVVAPSQRVARSVGGKLDGVHVIDDLSQIVGNAAAAQPGLLLASLLEQAEPGQVVALVALADGADVLLFRTTDAFGIVPAGASARGAARRRRAAAVRQVPRVARDAPGRAAASARAAARVGHGRRAQRGLEVRVRRLEGARHRCRAHASGARVA